MQHKPATWPQAIGGKIALWTEKNTHSTVVCLNRKFTCKYQDKFYLKYLCSAPSEVRGRNTFALQLCSVIILKLLSGDWIRHVYLSAQSRSLPNKFKFQYISLFIKSKSWCLPLLWGVTIFIGPINLILLIMLMLAFNFENYLLFNPLTAGNPVHMQDIGSYLTKVFKGHLLNLSRHS